MTAILRLRRGRKGQALLLVTLSLFAMCGLLGLAVDLGWSYFVKKSAQSAADAAALAAAHQALLATGEIGAFAATGGADCDGVTGNLLAGCHYAEKNDFNPDGHGGRQKINILDGTSGVTRQDGTTLTSCTTNPGLVGCVDYWVTVRAVESIPQLFSAVLGNATGLSSARSTAAVVEAQVNGSLILLNRTSDPGPNGPGIDAVANPIGAAAGIVVASKAPGTIPTSGVTGPLIAISPVVNPGMPDGPLFLDPMRGYPQPLLPTAALNNYAVVGGDMTGGGGGIFLCSPGNGPCQINLSANLAVGGSPTLASGNYFPTAPLTGSSCAGNTCLVTLGGGQLTISHNVVTFGGGSSFGYYFFFGGLNVSGGKMIMSPGEYVLVGSGPPAGTGNDFTASSTAEIDGTGAIMIFTGASGPFTGDAITAVGPSDFYPNLITQVNASVDLVAMAQGGQLAFGPVSLSGQAGIVSGLDANSTVIPQSLLPYGGLVLWQDQANSTVKYLPNGNVDISCGSMNSPCTKALTNPPVINVQTQLALGFTGTIYQPRGAWINIGPGTVAGQLQVITGAVTGGAGSAMGLTPPPANLRLRRRLVALIE